MQAQPTTTPRQLDIGVVFSEPMKDPGWFGKCALMGLMMLIPIVGTLNLMGWTKATATRRMAGQEGLPDANLSYVGLGWGLFLAWLPVAGVFFAATVLLAIVVGVGSQLGQAGAALSVSATVLYYVAILVGSLALSVVGPAINFLHIVDDEPWASMLIKRQIEIIKQSGTQYLLLWVAMLLVGLVAQLGVVACFVGMFLTIPYAQAMSGVAVAEFASTLRPPAPPPPMQGNAGGESGAPFGVRI
jgi:hypothetical protein